MEELWQHQRKAKELKQVAEDAEASEIQLRGTRTGVGQYVELWTRFSFNYIPTGIAEGAKHELQQEKKKHAENVTSLTTTVNNLQLELKSLRAK